MDTIAPFANRYSSLRRADNQRYDKQLVRADITCAKLSRVFDGKENGAFVIRVTRSEQLISSVLLNLVREVVLEWCSPEFGEFDRSAASGCFSLEG